MQFDLFDLSLDTVGVFKQFTAIVGQAQALTTAIKQTNAELALQLFEPSGHGGSMDTQLLTGTPH